MASRISGVVTRRRHADPAPRGLREALEWRHAEDRALASHRDRSRDAHGWHLSRGARTGAGGVGLALARGAASTDRLVRPRAVRRPDARAGVGQARSPPERCAPRRRTWRVGSSVACSRRDRALAARGGGRPSRRLEAGLLGTDGPSAGVRRGVGGLRRRYSALGGWRREQVAMVAASRRSRGRWAVSLTARPSCPRRRPRELPSCTWGAVL